MGHKLSKSTPVRGRDGGSTGKTVGGWTDQDVTNPQVLADARELAVIATKTILAEKNFEFSFANPVIEITNLQSQVVSGTNYRVEYSVEDTEGGHALFVTALMYRPLQQPITKSETIKYDYAYENINKPPSPSRQQGKVTTLNDKNKTQASSSTQRRARSSMRARSRGS